MADESKVQEILLPLIALAKGEASKVVSQKGLDVEVVETTLKFTKAGGN